ncbi:MAG: hypothetical protein AABZ83_15050 [candidate division NC10 bacterium]
MAPRLEGPAEQPPGVLVVLLRVAAAVHVEDDAARAVGAPAVVGEREAEVGLADPRGAVGDDERARQQPAAEHRVELREAGRNAIGHEQKFYTARPLVANWRS